MPDLGVRKAKALWPRLQDADFVLTSERDEDYNCVAWAMRDKRRWWEPSDDLVAHYWPNNATRNYSLDAYMEAFGTRHYVACVDGSLELGIEKLAIYWSPIADEFRHVARQLADGRWTSKLGEAKDIAHVTLEALNGDHYGEPIRFMQRPRPSAT